MTKAIVLLSGGIDSAVCLQKALHQHLEVEAIHFNYGQQTEHIERRNAQKQCGENDVELHVIDYRDVFSNFAEGTIEDKEYDGRKLSEGDHSVGYVPQRNAHMITTGAAIAEYNTETGEDIKIYHGAQANDAEDYPDCRTSFIKAIEKSVNQGTDHHDIDIVTPIIDMDKDEVLRLGQKLDVNWELTFSCYNDNGGEPCGECPACVERKEAFNKVNLNDPLLSGKNLND